MYFLAENLPEVSSVVMNYKMRHNMNRPARYSLNRKTRSGHARLCARIAMEEGLLSVCVSQSIGQSWLVNEYCYLLNSEFEQRISDLANVFSRTTPMKVIRESFLP